MWLSLVERCVRDAKAAGSNPVIPTISSVLNQPESWMRTLDFFLPTFVSVPKVRQFQIPYKLVVNMLFQNRIILDVGGFPYFAFSQAQPFVAVKSKAMSCAGLRCRFACKQSHLVFCNFFFCLLVGFTVTKAVLDFAGQFIALDIPSLPPSVFSLENVFTLLYRLKPPIFIVRSDTIYFSK